MDQGARDRISKANEDNASHFIWAELPKNLKAQWDMRLIRSVLDTCRRLQRKQRLFAAHVRILKEFGYCRYSTATAGNRFVRLYDDVITQRA
jgi:hypothetical protein